MTEINLFKSSPDAYVVQPGEALFREGDAGDSMFAVIEGDIEVTLGGEVIEHVGPGGVLGELALIDASPRAATATASVTSRIARVDEQHFMFLVQQHPTFALQVMRVMADRLRHANESRAAG
jgi:CRP/FNR family transcriptional regulator, cyclic AMP receptor protein